MEYFCVHNEFRQCYLNRLEKEKIIFGLKLGKPLIKEWDFQLELWFAPLLNSQQ